MSVKARRAMRGAAAVVVASTLLVATPAQAERHVRVDPARDMFLISEPDPVRDRAHRNMDLRKVIVRHRAHRLTIRAQVTALRVHPGRHGGVGMSGFVRVNQKARPYDGRGVAYEFRVFFDSRAPHRPALMEVLDAPHEDVGCFVRRGSGNNLGMRAHANYKRDVMVFSMPHSCLGNPNWARVSVSTEMRRGREMEWMDDWVNPFDPFNYTNLANYSPRLGHG